MTLHIRILSGSRAGQSLSFSDSPVTLGRDPTSTVPLDPMVDLAVSAQHAVLFKEGTGWFVRDLGSLNGTFLDGRRVEGDTRVNARCRLRLGIDGPELGIEVVHGQAKARAEGHQGWSAFEHVGPKLVAAVLVASLVAVVAGLLARGARERAAWAQERADLLAHVDSVLVESEAATRGLEGYATELADTLRSSREEIRRLQAEIGRQVEDDPADTGDLERRLQAATTALTRLELAANIDWAGIRSRTVPSVARVFVEAEGGAIEAGTAFLVRDDGTFVTAGHIVAGGDGQRRIRRLAVQLSDTQQLRDARVLTVMMENDLALIRADLDGAGTGAVQLNARPDTIATGQPVALVGFPLGGGPGEGSASPVSSAGILIRSGSDRLEIQGYSERGASGSPVIDSRGAVIGLLRGAVDIEGTRLLVAVPSPTINELLAR